MKPFAVGDDQAAPWRADTDDRLAELFRADHQALVRYVRMRYRPADPEDVVQEAFGRLVHEVARTAWPERPSAWLRRVIANLAVSDWRHGQVVDRHMPRVDPAEAPDDAAVRREISVALSSALKTLAPDARRAVVMAARGYSNREIATRLGRTELATRTLLCRSRAQLRVRLADTPNATHATRATVAAQRRHGG